MKIIKKAGSIAVAAALVATLTTSAVAYPASYDDSCYPYGMLTGSSKYRVYGNSVVFSASSVVSQTAPNVGVSIRLTNTETNSVYETGMKRKFDTAKVSNDTPGFNSKYQYNAVSIHVVYGGSGRTLARFKTSISNV